jgi:excisionase family DNA binding protein
MQSTALNEALRNLVAEVVEEKLKESTPQKTIITVKEAAKRYGIYPSTIYDWMNQGVIRKHSIGGRTFCFIEDFEKSNR